MDGTGKQLLGLLCLMLIIVDHFLDTFRSAKDRCCGIQCGTPILLMNRQLEQRSDPAALLQMPTMKAIIQQDQFGCIPGELLPITSRNIYLRHIVESQVLLFPPLGVRILRHRRNIQSQ
ncbi:hypothetical protein D3C71_1537590 [compost metagenome]